METGWKIYVEANVLSESIEKVKEFLFLFFQLSEEIIGKENSNCASVSQGRELFRDEFIIFKAASFAST